MKPNFFFVVVKMLLAGIKKPVRIPHLLQAFRGFRRNREPLRRWRRSHPDTVLISLIEHMGDIVAAEPMSRLARRQRPQAAIGWVTRAPYAGVLDRFAAVDTTFPVQCMTEWLLLWSGQPDAATWDLHISERPCPTCGVFYRKPGPPGRVTYRTYYNEGNLLAVNCLSAGMKPFDDTPQLTPDPGAVRAVDTLGLDGRIAVIHCKSNEDRRDWLVEKWEELVGWMQESFGLAIYEVGSQAQVIRHDGPRTRSLCGSLSVAETTEVLRRAQIFVGIDSGPAHLANAAGTPGVILLGHYENFRTYTPYSGGYGDGTRAELVRADGPARDIEIGRVKAAVARRLGARQRTAGIEPAARTS